MLPERMSCPAADGAQDRLRSRGTGDQCAGRAAVKDLQDQDFSTEPHRPMRSCTNMTIVRSRAPSPSAAFPRDEKITCHQAWPPPLVSRAHRAAAHARLGRRCETSLPSPRLRHAGVNSPGPSDGPAGWISLDHGRPTADRTRTVHSYAPLVNGRNRDPQPESRRRGKHRRFGSAEAGIFRVNHLAACRGKMPGPTTSGMQGGLAT
jgi:hypothetical protein